MAVLMIFRIALKALGRNNGLVDAHGVVGIHHQRGVVTNQLPHRPDTLDVFLKVLPPDLDLDRIDTLGR